MKKPPAVAAQSARSVTVLSVEPSAEDSAALVEIFKSAPWGLCPDAVWTLESSVTLHSAWALLREESIPIVLCECDLKPGTWRELLEQVSALPAPPFLIVTSRRADERLWAEALNLGAYDVLAKPYDQTEVTRVVSLAWLHWRERYTSANPEVQSIAAGS
jgi:DNA-binding response OmpR family regulator